MKKKVHIGYEFNGKSQEYDYNLAVLNDSPSNISVFLKPIVRNHTPVDIYDPLFLEHRLNNNHCITVDIIRDRPNVDLLTRFDYFLEPDKSWRMLGHIRSDYEGLHRPRLIFSPPAHKYSVFEYNNDLNGKGISPQRMALHWDSICKAIAQDVKWGRKKSVQIIPQSLQRAHEMNNETAKPGDLGKIYDLSQTPSVTVSRERLAGVFSPAIARQFSRYFLQR
ncbi:MAG: hypothetical protein ACMXYF_05075 [Candidatus Woesearchaeota archaeon]